MDSITFNIYDVLTKFLEEQGVTYQTLVHTPEGRTAFASEIRGHDLSLAAKAIVIMVTKGKKKRHYCLAVVPGHCTVDFEAIREIYGGNRAMLAPKERAEKLTNCVMGAVPPFTFHREMSVIADFALQKNQHIVMSAGRLDISIVLDVQSYIKLAQPQWGHIIAHEKEAS